MSEDDDDDYDEDADHDEGYEDGQTDRGRHEEMPGFAHVEDVVFGNSFKLGRSEAYKSGYEEGYRDG